MSVGAVDGLDLVVDASVGVKWLVPESHSDEASLLMSSDVRRHVPTLFYTEVAQTIWKKAHTRREISAEDGRELFRRLRLLPLIMHPIEPLFDLSFEIALRTGRTVYDSVYLAMAKSKGWKFVTADERLYNALKGSDLEEFLIWVGDVSSIFPGSQEKSDEETLVNFVIPNHPVPHLALEEIELIHSAYTNDRLTDDHLALISENVDTDTLHFNNSLVTNSGLIHLRRMAKLRILILRNTGIGDSGLLHLRDLQYLETLDLAGTYVTDAGLELLRFLPKLRTLYLADTETTEAGRARLREAVPDLSISE